MQPTARTGALLIALLLMLGFFYLAAKDIEHSRIAGSKSQSKNSAGQVSPVPGSAVQQAGNTSTSQDSTAESPQEPEGTASRQVTYLSMEEARTRCMEEYRQTGKIAIGENSYCALYARMLDKQFNALKPGPAYVEPAQSVASPASHAASNSQAQEVASATVVDRAYLVNACGDRFDDISWRDVSEMERRLRHRIQSQVPADAREVQELRCRIEILKSAG